MTEKQFIYNRCEDGFYDIIDIKNHHTYPIGNMEIFVIGIVELLNNLHEENQQLKQELKNGICPLCGARVSKCGGLK